MDPNSITTFAQSTDWGLVSTVVQIAVSVATCIVMLITAWVAMRGITAWRHEFRGKRQIELAEDVLTLFYEAKDAISAIRSPYSFEGEGSTRKSVEGETEQEKKAKDRAYIVWERYYKHQSVFNKLYALRYRFMAQIGREQAEPFEQIRKIVDEIFRAASTLGVLWSAEKKELNKTIKLYEEVFWWQGSKDEIDKRLAGIISQMEETCQLIMMKAGHKR